MPLIARKKALLCKIESSYGVDSTPTAAANAFLARNVNLTPLEQITVPREIVQSWMGNADELVAASYMRLDFEIEIAGSGTAGTAPPWGPAMRACACAQTLLAATHAGTATAGAASTITLAAGASAVDDTYNGLIIRTTGGTGTGQRRLIYDYVGATKVATVSYPWATAPDATTTYSLDAQACYAPVTSAHESVVFYFYVDGVLHKMLGARGTVGLRINRLGDPVLMFSFTGLYVAVADSALITPTLSGFQTPLAVNNTNTTGFALHSYAGVLDNLSANYGNNVVYRHLVGSETVIITDRKPTGSVMIEAALVASKDWWALARAATLGPMTILHGTAAGNKVYVDSFATQVMRPRYSDTDGVQMLNLDLLFKPGTYGNDDLVVTAI